MINLIFKKGRLVCIAIVFLFNLHSNAQQIDSTLAKYADHFTAERIHLHLDRNIYSTDETVYFKAYIFQGHGLSSISKNLYVDFYNSHGELIEQAVAPLIQSTATGSFTIPHSYKGNTLAIKAYTKWMLNFDTAFVISRLISIRNPAEEIKNTKEIKSNKENSTTAFSQPVKTGASSAVPDAIKIYPEGGFAVEGLTNHFAFAAVDELKNPLPVKGVIRNNAGKAIDSFAATHDGMGAFKIKSETGEKYFLEWKDGIDQLQTTGIPIEKKSGVTLHVEHAGRKAFVTLERTPGTSESFKIMHLLIHQENLLNYKFDINLSEKSYVGFPVSTAEMSAGIVQFTLFNSDWIPVAERVLFADNKNYLFVPEIKLLKKDLGNKGKNEIEISVPDTVLANMSVSVADAGTICQQDEQTIISDFLLAGQVKGKINNPAYYFANASIDSAETADNLDLLLMTHGHRRYDWEKITKGKLPVIHYPAEADYIGIRGAVKEQKFLNSGNGLTMNLVVQAKNSGNKVYTVPVERDGSFEKMNLFYYDTVQVFYNLNEKKTAGFQNSITITNSLLQKEQKDIFFAGRGYAAGYITGNTGTDTFFNEQAQIKRLSGYKTLKEITVSSRVKTKLQVIDNFYTHGVFTGEGNNYMIDVEGDFSARGYSNIFDYLQSKLPGLTVFPVGGSVGVTWFRSFELVGPEQSPIFFLDEVQVPIETVLTVPVADIAYAKGFRPPFVGSFLNGVNGTIALYTKKGNSPVYQSSGSGGMASLALEGYTKFREFTEPDYSSGKPDDKNDYRATVYWNAYLFTDRNNPVTRFEFYNNDISKKLLIVLEGVNAEGKLARVVKMLE